MWGLLAHLHFTENALGLARPIFFKLEQIRFEHNALKSLDCVFDPIPKGGRCPWLFRHRRIIVKSAGRCPTGLYDTNYQRRT